ncbi:MAG: hypothetical protein AABY15_04265 [Nanoarchaeota archaeon]
MDSNEEIRKKALEIISIIKEAENELKLLRKLCKHSEYQVKDINFGIGGSKLRKSCKFCDEILGFPSKDDLKNNGYS